MTVTYQQLYDVAFAKIVSQCVNVSNFANLPSMFKSGYTYVLSNGRPRVTYTISNYVSEYTSSAVGTAFKATLAKYGITDLSLTASSKGILNFYKALITFCTANVRICGCQLTTNKYIVYVPGTEETPTVEGEGELIGAYDLESLMTSVSSIIAGSIKAYEVRYTTSFTIA